MRRFHILILVLFMWAGISPCRAQDGGPSVIRLRSLLAPGNKVAVVFKDLSDDFDEKDAYIRQ